ncbi:hypothetical protein GCM10029976_079570 [Kribbella albertanoniae]
MFALAGPPCSPDRFRAGPALVRRDLGRIPPNPSVIHPKPVWGGRFGMEVAGCSPNRVGEGGHPREGMSADPPRRE